MSELTLQRPCVNMSKGQALRDLVMERLVVAADEIFALFERTIAEYEEEALRSRLQLQEPRAVLHKEDVPTLSVHPEVGISPEHTEEEQGLCVKQEEEAPLEFPFSPFSVKTEDNVDTSSLLQQDPTEENREDTVGEQCEREEPGCSLDLPSENMDQTYNSFDTDDSEDWEPSAKRSTKCAGQGLIKDSKRGRAAKNEKQNKNTLSDRSSNTITNKDLAGCKRKAKQCKCSVCGKVFQSDAHLQKHVFVHSGQRPYKCPVCNKAFRNQANFSKHLIVHTEDKPFSCPACKRGFSQKCHLQAHMSIHTGEKPFSCPDCGVRFRYQRNIYRHITAVHKGEKPYRCPFCDKAFSQKSSFIVHMRTHTGEKPFSCTICKKGFIDNCHLKKHAKTHAVQNEEKD